MKFKKFWQRKNKSFDYLTKLLFTASFILGLILTFIVPPFQKPDEIAHFYKSISVARGNLICSKGNTATFQNLLPKYLVEFPTDTFALHVAFKPHIPFPPNLYTHLLTKSNYDISLVNEPSACSLPFVLYAPAGLVLSLPVLLGLNPLFIFYLGRLTNFLLSISIFYFAIKITSKKLKLIPLFVLILPMTLHQLSSYSKDALHLAFGVLAFTYLMKLIKTKKFNKKDILIFLASLALSILARPQYFLLSLLPLALVKKKIPNLKFKLIAFAFICILLLSVGTAISLEIYSAKALSLGNVETNTNIYPHLQLKTLLESPLRFPKIIHDTLDKDAEKYTKELIGVFGWLDYEIPWYIYLIYIGLFFIILNKTKKHFPTLSTKQFLIINIVSWGSMMGLFLAMYLYATPVAGIHVKGLQGRYFILLIPLLIWISADILKKLKGKENLFLIILLVVSIFSAVVNRYYNYDHYYYNTRADREKNLASDSILETEKVDVFLQEKISVDINKKIAGISVYLIENEKLVLKPYQIELRDKNCADIIEKKIIDSSTLTTNGWNDFVFKPFNYKNEKNLCVQIKPYHIRVNKNESLNLLKDKSSRKVILQPLYLF
ncbi:MAG: DUF2142 domain-containing protein [Patescibacteria group bacterium]